MTTTHKPNATEIINMVSNARASGLTTFLHLNTLAALSSGKEYSASELAKKVGTIKESMTNVVDHLVKLDLATRRNGTRDRRKVLIKATERGRLTAAEIFIPKDKKPQPATA